MATPTYSPHPLLQDPILYVVDPPKCVKWAHLKKILSSCGSVTTLGKNTVQNTPPGAPKREKYPVCFSSTFEAEMALATLQDTVVTDVSPPWKMVLSHSPTLELALPAERIWPQYIRLVGVPYGMGNNPSAQKLFRWFRSVGPLVSVRTNVYIGYPQLAIVIEYWSEEHAKLARKIKNQAHVDLHGLPEFTLRTFDPCNLFCTDLESPISQELLRKQFSKFGTITNLVLKRASAFSAFITFSSRESAAAAIRDMKRKRVGDTCVRYHEPIAQTVFRPHSTANTTNEEHDDASSVNDDAGSSGFQPDKANEQAAKEKAAQQRREAAAQELREAAERRAREIAAMEAAEAKVKGHREWQVRRDAAVRAERIAKKNLLAAHADDGDADRAVLKASGGKASAERVLVGAKAASALAKRLWMEAVARENEAERQVTQCQDELEDAVRQKKNTEVRLCIAEQEVLTFRTARENIDKEAEAGGIDEETARLADLAEKVRKMEELRKIEQEEREEREKKKREAVKEEAERLEKEALERAEAERRGREQAEAMERLAQEQKEREEQARRAAEYNRTVSLERARCLKRDLKFCKNGNLNIWNTQCALQRFVSVSKEFDTLKFQAPAQPLVFENIPWPILDHPHRMALDRVESQAVDKFFAAIKDVMQTEEYVALFKKARNRFHPDRWRSRGILNSVLDENLRGRLEVAGIEVSKQINHLWDKIVQ